MSLILIWLIVFVTCLLIFYLLNRKYQMNILKRNGIPGPKPNLITGNMFEFFSKTNLEKYDEYFRRYGKTCGYFVGRKINILTIDLELIKRVQIKDFEVFSDRQNFGIKHGIRPNPKYDSHIISNKGLKWKETRSLLNPTFSALKLKLMTPIIESAIDIFIEKVEKQSKIGQEFNIYEDFQLLTADVISKSALGIDTNVQYDPNNEFFLAAKRIFDTKPNKFLLMFLCFPELDFLLYPFRRFLQILNELMGYSTDITLAKLINKAIELRKLTKNNNNVGAGAGGKKFTDLLQLMLDAKLSEEELSRSGMANLSIEMSNDNELLMENGNGNPIKNGNINANGNINRKLKSLSQNEVIANANVFYEAGYETTSTALGFITHFLVTRPDIQDKVRQEVENLFETEGKFDYNTVNKLNYMQCVINESLRFYPPVTSFITRNTLKDYYYEDICIPKESTIRIPTYQLHHCEDYWPEPERFDPDRFLLKTNYEPLSFQAFGNGPRNCIGMRFALYEIKLTLAKLLHRFRLVPGPSTEQDLTIEAKIITETPKYGIFVKAVPL